MDEIKPLNLVAITAEIFSGTNNMDPSTAFPAEIILDHIMPNLNLDELCTLRCVSRLWCRLVNARFSRIRHLDLTQVTGILTEPGFKAIAQHFSKLQEICLDACWMIASKANLIILFNNCPKLRAFSSKRCKYVDDEVLGVIAVKCKSIEAVNINNCFQVTNIGIIELFRNCKKLCIFSASGNYGFTDEAVKYIGMNCETIEELDCGSCFYISDTGIAELLKGKCNELSYIRIKGCSKVSDDMTRKLVQRGIVVNNCF